jgi:thiosulfate/3-mercaptopyruvate sulfurtransferase
LEVWQKVLVDPEFLSDDVHSKPGCIACHGGTPGVIDKAQAHTGLYPKASANAERSCGGCHVGIVEQARTSMHRLQPGYLTVMSERGADFTLPETVRAYTTHCTKCHADCGDCHISRPSALDGGLIAGHEVKRVASVFVTCGGCHSARINDEYKGVHEGIPGDVHWEKAGMPCTECHTMEEFHDGQHGTRYDTDPSVDCIDCHQDDVQLGGDNLQHTIHTNTVQCQVCHSAGAYKSCFTCHTGKDEQGIPYTTSDPSQMTFKIGRNPLQSESRPWNYVLLRHVPTNPDLWAFYGDDLLPEFDNLPTWKATTPHNIQKITPQNETCNSCHGQADLFLTAEDVDPAMLNANRGVIVTRIPPTRPEVQQNED